METSKEWARDLREWEKEYSLNVVELVNARPVALQVLNELFQSNLRGALAALRFLSHDPSLAVHFIPELVYFSLQFDTAPLAMGVLSQLRANSYDRIGEHVCEFLASDFDQFIRGVVILRMIDRGICIKQWLKLLLGSDIDAEFKADLAEFPVNDES